MNNRKSFRLREKDEVQKRMVPSYSFARLVCILLVYGFVSRISVSAFTVINPLRMYSFSIAMENGADNTDEKNVVEDYSGDGLGEYKPSDRLPGRGGGEEVLVGDPQQKPQKEMSVSNILQELAAIQEQGDKKYCVLGTRHCSLLHQQIIELLAYALVLSGNHVYTSGAGGTHAATIRGALRAERPDLLTVVLPQSLYKQPEESQDIVKNVTDLVTMPQNDNLSLDVASRICNKYLLSLSDQLIAFAFHDSKTVIEATREAKESDMLVTTLYLD